MKGNGTDTVCIACSVFRAELEALQQRGSIDPPIRFLDSKLHLKPGALHEHMIPLLMEELDRGNKVILLYGDCHPHMVDLESHPGVARTSGQNCGEILLGHERYWRLLKEGAFFLFPEWTLRWREIFGDLDGPGQNSTIGIMQDRQSSLTYLNTGVLPIPHDELKTCSEYFGLPSEVLDVSLDHLLSSISDAIEEVNSS